MAKNGLKCECGKTYFENSQGLCESCGMAGCLSCRSLTFCYECDRANGYYLTESSCKLMLIPKNYAYVQSSPGIILQFKVPYDSKQYSELRNVNGSLSTIIQDIDDDSTIVPPMQLELQ